ncbi:MAG: hypothetical protein AAFX03_06025 [Pseudomonadota bacterium]
MKRIAGLVTAAALAASSAAPALARVADNPSFNVRGLIIVWSGDEITGAPVVRDFIINTTPGAGDADLIAQDAHTVLTGTLVSTLDSGGGAAVQNGIPFIIENTGSGDLDTDVNNDGVIDASDAFSGFSIDGTSNARVDGTTTSSSFYVASNTPFSIDAVATAPTSTLNFILLLITQLNISVERAGDDGLAFGSAAQFPHSAGPTGGVAAGANLFSLLGGQTVFTGDQRTAASRGSIADQSVRFDLLYTIGAGSLTGYDLSLGTFDFEVEVTYTLFAP